MCYMPLPPVAVILTLSVPLGTVCFYSYVMYVDHPFATIR